MDKLTKEAKAYCVAFLEAQGREFLVQQLEGICVACYDEEDAAELAESAADSVEAGDIEFDWSFAPAKASKHHVYMLWLDVDEVWEDTV